MIPITTNSSTSVKPRADGATRRLPAACGTLRNRRIVPASIGKPHKYETGIRPAGDRININTLRRGSGTHLIFKPRDDPSVAEFFRRALHVDAMRRGGDDVLRVIADAL